MPYLYITDYTPPLQPAMYQQLVQGVDGYRIQEQQKALSKVKGVLQQKYDVSQEFTDTLPWSATAQYAARSRVIIDYPLWITEDGYIAGNCVIYENVGYVCTIANNDATFTSGNWASLGAQYTIYYCSYPPTCTYPPTLANPNAPVFNLNMPYSLGDIIYWKGYTYACTNPSCRINDVDMIQFYKIANVPYVNVFPDDIINNSSTQFWGSKTAYTIPTGTLPTNITYWTQGDNREQQAVDAMRWIVIHNLAPLISPKVIPDAWKIEYHRVLEALDMMKDGQITVDIPLLQPNTGQRIRYGGYAKNANLYSVFWMLLGIKVIIGISILAFIKNIRWSKVYQPRKKPLVWWYHKILCEISYSYFGRSNHAYYRHLAKLCETGYNLYGRPITPKGRQSLSHWLHKRKYP